MGLDALGGLYGLFGEHNLLFLRISVIMGVSWIFNLVRLNSFWQEALKIADYYHYALGIITFVLLILKPSTLNLLMDR
ncbi:hypothetical protein M5D96_011327 [Drosophila gunungcola]|uniref:Uncharacterized protein n=1 Tax=Drosophila gunungcola TaxID=103775 RepID=A0A9P9YFI8_9MUSC|nr:hypothetical protein M5D96_011327 [Drosophila gunungcola]